MSDAAELSELYARMLDLQAQFFASETREVLSALPAFTNAKRMLEIGCGNGAQIDALAELLVAKQYVGVDISEPLVARAQKRVGTNSSIELHVADVMSLEPDRPFQFILSWAVLQHLPDTERALSKLHELLEPGGVLLVYDSNLEPEFVSSPPMPAVLGAFHDISEDKTDGKRKTSCLTRALGLAPQLGFEVVLNQRSDFSARDQDSRDLCARYLTAMADLLVVMYGSRIDREKYGRDLESWRSNPQGWAVFSGDSWVALQRVR